MSRKHFPVEGKRIWVCGHRGMIGSALMRRLRARRCELLTAGRRALDLTRQADVLAWLSANRREPANIGVGNEVSIRTIAETIAGITGYDGRLEFDANKPDGMQRKCLDGSRLAATGWRGGRPLNEGRESAYRYFLEHVARPAPTQNEPQAAAIHHA